MVKTRSAGVSTTWIRRLLPRVPDTVLCMRQLTNRNVSSSKLRPRPLDRHFSFVDKRKAVRLGDVSAIKSPDISTTQQRWFLPFQSHSHSIINSKLGNSIELTSVNLSSQSSHGHHPQHGVRIGLQLQEVMVSSSITQSGSPNELCATCFTSLSPSPHLQNSDPQLNTKSTTQPQDLHCQTPLQSTNGGGGKT